MGVTRVHVEGEKTVVLAADVNVKALKLSRVIVPNSVVVTYESLDRRHQWYDVMHSKSRVYDVWLESVNIPLYVVRH
jgi:hypothetical protein